MRRINSDFRTQYMSEEGQKLANRDYFGYVEMDDFACYVLADSLDGDVESNSAKFVVDSLIRSFVENPTMRTGKLKHYMHLAHRELLKQRGGMHLKASVTIVVSDYKKIKYCYVGNSRFYFIRNSRILFQTKDQSLTETLLKEEKITLDQAAAHEERNNLYSFLGERGEPEIVVSKKIKLENGDSFAILTRGAWENLGENEFLEISNEAKEPSEILEKAEDIILGKQTAGEIDNYSVAVTFVDKVYLPPKKKFSVKKILLIALPVLLIVAGLSLALFLRSRSIKKKEESLTSYLQSGKEYLKYDNYQKASEEYAKAKKIAESLKKKEIYIDADDYQKLADQIILSDEAIFAKEYKKAQNLYIKARNLSMQTGNVGKQYIENQLKQTKNYIDVFDLMEMGQQKEEYGDIEGAIKAYQQARELAASLYFDDGKKEAMAKLTAIEEKVEKNNQKTEAVADAAKKESQEEEEKSKKEEEEKRELENQQKLNDQQNAMDLEVQANKLLSEEKFESAITYYQTAQAIYVRLELLSLADKINDKIAAARAGIKAKEADIDKLKNQAKPNESDIPDKGPGINSSSTDK
ncbi:hypothetical protein [Clostridium sp. E02]|uniref:PP2C family protein-serine/threonine phosphatase n=1 Tax=Clostridium sp. E02 TaxID=2487134 RepID=UPI000F5281C2|nr:hypothetical protein [Clostridium sp. E02]